jgi:hypothetical protein
MKEVRKIYDKAFKDKAVQLSYDRTNVSRIVFNEIFLVLDTIFLRKLITSTKNYH